MNRIKGEQKNIIDKEAISSHIDDLMAKNYFYTIDTGSVIYRVETEERKDDIPKFYSYFRDPTACSEIPWLKRCRGSECTKYTLQTVSEMKLLIVPYKSVLYEDDATDRDIYLESVLLSLVNLIYKDKSYRNCLKRSISHLIDYEGDVNPCTGLSPDWYLAIFICDLGLNGFIRTVESGTPEMSETNCFDEITICDSNFTEVVSKNLWIA